MAMVCLQRHGKEKNPVCKMNSKFMLWQPKRKHSLTLYPPPYFSAVSASFGVSPSGNLESRVFAEHGASKLTKLSILFTQAQA